MTNESLPSESSRPRRRAGAREEDPSQGDGASGFAEATEMEPVSPPGGQQGAQRSGLPAPQPAGDQPKSSARAPDFVVGVGASAGGLVSIEAFMHNIPATGHVSYVLVQHLAPDHRSLMSEILVKHTSLKVVQAEHETRLEPDTVYLIPPGKLLRVVNGVLRLSERVPASLHFPIDVFFRSLAEDCDQRALAVVLSGTGTDGTEGIRYIKQCGGMVLVQDDTAQFDGMPRSAISTGLADFILPADEIANKVVELTRIGSVVAEPVAQGLTEDVLAKILDLVKRSTGSDFSGYRQTTVRRRIEKRMWARHIDNAITYLDLLRQERDEAEVLSKEVLIGVTSLFRDPEAYESMRRSVLPSILGEDRSPRIWVVGCSTGEEAYSLAIAIDQQLHEKQVKGDFQIFATDIDDRAIEQAGKGIFPARIAEVVDSSVLKRYFTSDGRGRYVISPRVRERIVFAKHDIMRDPPFTRVDLVTCRNMLIYQQADLQQRTLATLQFALREGGYLWLGASESLGARSTAFESVDKRWRIFRLLEGGAVDVPAVQPVFSAASRRGAVEQKVRRQETELLSRICATLVRHRSEAALVVSPNDTILYLFGDSSRYVALPEGRPTYEVSRALKGHIGEYVVGLMRRARRKRGAAIVGRTTLGKPAERVGVGGQEQEAVEVAALRVGGDEPDPIYVVVLRSWERSASEEQPVAMVADESLDERIDELESELFDARAKLQVTIEELETSNEELQSANEELIASNQELQSTNEELHSVNEELHTVNAEYQRKLSEQNILTADMDHLLQATDVGTLFLDAAFRVRRYTPAITRVIPLLPSDHGRPVGHIRHLLLDLDLEAIARRVRESQRIEQQVRTSDGAIYELRAVPYYDFGEHVDGVVLTLFDVTALENARHRAAEGEHRFRQVAANIDQVIWVRNCVDGSFEYLSPVAESLWGRPTEDLVADQNLWLHSIHEEDRERVRHGYERGLRRGSFEIEYRICQPDGRVRWVRDRGFPIVEEAEGTVSRVAGVTTDVTADKQTEDELRDQAKAMSELALHDALTGLHNRRGFAEQLEEEVVRARRTGDSLMAVLVDCDNFKHINDEYGHPVGDDVLREVANRLAHSLRPTDVLARIGGDEFVALLPATRNAEALRVAERMRSKVAESPVAVASKDIMMTVSIGVDSVSLDDESISSVLAKLDQGLSSSKRGGKNRVANARGDGFRVESSEQLVSLLENDKAFRVVAQTIRNIEDNRVVGYELLSRGPKGDYESPELFFRLATELSMLARVDASCLCKCLSAAGKLVDRDRDLRVHVNAYPSTLLELSAKDLQRAFAGIGRPDGICLEVSEQQVVGEPNYLRDVLASLRELGVRIAIDDVGFGRSSLESLIVLEPEIIKIDRSFVHGVSEQPFRRSSLARLLNVTRGLDTEVVAEGVETAEDAKVLVELGVQLAQGFLWDRPAAIESLN